MDKAQKIKIGISIGDINGIGIELILKTFKDARMMELCTPVIFGSSKVISQHRKALNMNVQTQTVPSVDKLISGKLNVVSVWKEEVEVSLGKATKVGGEYAAKSLEAATSALKDGYVDVLITAPINKETIQSEEFTFPGHTEFLQEKLGGESLMILMSDSLRVALVTGHIPVSKISETIQPDLIERKYKILHETLIRDFNISKPRIAVLGLNPHNGDSGVIGTEDDTVVRPTINALKEKGYLAFGPFAADGFFGSSNYKSVDAVLAMYHDQGLAPFKALSFGKGVNYTSGLTKIRTSPDHGTAFDLAGKGKADTSSFKEALYSAIAIFKTRNEYDNLTKNPLKIINRGKKI